MKYTDKALKAWRDSIEPASYYGDCLFLRHNKYEKVKLTCRCNDGTAIIIHHLFPGALNVMMERLFPLDYLDDADKEEGNASNGNQDQP